MLFAKRFLIKGKVQGVFFRASARDFAIQRNLNGWIRNTADGNVEAFVEGKETDIEEFYVWCQSGPPKAKVASVEVFEETEMFHNDFVILKD